jgi:ligand-binding sensor domain-containing protein
MKKCMLGIVLAAIALPLFAGSQKHETKTDSMSYETGAEWKIYSTGGAVRGFALYNNAIWSVTEAGITSVSVVATKKGDMQTYKDLGGIPAADATCIAVDYSGVVWIGTKAGLVMKTKDSFKVFTKDKGLSDNTVNKILPGKAGKLWVATENGVSVYQNGAWTAYTSKDGLAGDKVRDIIMGPNGTVWFGTNKGISCLDGTTWSTHNMKNGLSWNDTKALGVDSRTGMVWAAVGDKDMNAYDGKTWKVFMEVSEGIVAIMVDTQSRVWIATPTGLMKFNGDEWLTDPQKIGITAAQVTQMQRDDKGNLWFGMESGVLKLDNPYPY